MKNLVRILLGLLEAILIGLLVRYTNFEVAVLVILIQIYIEVFTSDIDE